MSDYRDLHTPDVYRQWYNLCTLYQRKVDPRWLDGKRISQDALTSRQIADYTASSEDKVLGYARFLMDMYQDACGRSKFLTGTPLLDEAYYPGRDFKKFIVPRPHSCLGYVCPRNVRNAWDELPAEKGAEIGTVARFTSTGVKVYRKTSWSLRSRGIEGSRPKAISVRDDLFDIRTLEEFFICSKTVQIVELPASREKITCVPEPTDKQGDPFSPLFSQRRETVWNEAVRNLPVNNPSEGWYVRAYVDGYKEHRIMNLKEFMMEWELDGQELVGEEHIARLLSRGVSVAEILKVSEKVRSRPFSSIQTWRIVESVSSAQEGSGGVW